jgi:CO dehydrogenase maturation factor
MRLAIAGKGGTGKTTISATLARILARDGRNVLAVDADTSPNLAAMLGIPPEQAQAVLALPRNLIERRERPDGTMESVFAADPEELIADMASEGPDGVKLLMMGRVDHGGAG